MHNEQSPVEVVDFDGAFVLAAILIYQIHIGNNTSRSEFLQLPTSNFYFIIGIFTPIFFANSIASG
jgi:hypothetical protein